MLLLVLLVAAPLTGARGEERAIPRECSQKLHTLYEELGCTAVYGAGPCPVKYDCPNLQSRSNNKCHVGGEQYEPGASIGDYYRACSAACVCRDYGESAKIMCAQIECPELFNPEYRPPNCIPQYTHDACCSESQFCPNATKNTTDITCEHKGKILMQGQKYYPDEEPCKVCVCQEGYDGTLNEPWCKRIYCGIELRHDEDIRSGCIPVYYGGCCPVTYRCPEEGDRLRQLPDDEAQKRTSADKCVYGSLEMNVGDMLDLGADNCTVCTCETPPLATCNYKCTR
ncbi:kielin/chordin-like protein [Bacillus rossius redtenbacheri]|uniref:kielin/chordin-like protein n=1 Tax=Bacillus rossius redtenbacheri TaxID=93214 RepID=UPI002FDCBC8B